ncbi:DarT ssDNA thymidine ADP-ribosyltransferase family protein [Indiicoccus explosivorum]|uniref:DarT ssDNA thymidine ADP-ribosyltransferase family protein n=1 Tax=Indiicoccus explosivorum TaxID=1917864 RepID=UPI000B440C2F|nr:DarT ssDNA thymidine ADP-ribosyltransferase family protein [Indiicoccus explosivorum]
MNLKSNSEHFEELIDQLISGAIDTGLPPIKRKLIPRFVYHFTDLQNAVSVLQSGFIYSRKTAEELGVMKVDNASSEVINHTNENWKNYVRFYFRPKTPTQYRNEGIRGSTTLSSLNAHCPVPVFLLFDIKEMLTRSDTQFSYGNLAVEDQSFSRSEDFARMPFKSIYHEGSYNTETEGHIKIHRHAELIVPEKCSLESLKFIVVRSSAEKETFLNTLDRDTRKKYKDIVMIDSRNNFYYGNWTFVEEVHLSKNEIVLSINKGEGRDKFKTSLRVLEKSSGQIYRVDEDRYMPEHAITYNLNQLNDSSSYEVKLYLDDHLAYHGIFLEKDVLPF